MKKFILIITILIYIISFLPANKKKIKQKKFFEMTIEELMNYKISSVSKYKQTIKEAPGSIQIITNHQIKERAYFDLSDLLKDLPGIDIVDNARGFGEFYTIRGIEGNDRFLVLIDGQKINPVSGTFLSIGNSLSIRFAQRVEIIYGPTSAVYGADAFAGTINIITGKSQQESVLNTYFNYGSNNTFDAGVELRKKISADLSVSLTARIFKSDGPDFIDPDNVYSEITRYTLPLRNEFEQPVNDHNILLKGKYKNFKLSWFRQQFDEGNAFTMDPKIYVYNKENRWKFVTNILWAEYKKDVSEDGYFSFYLSYVNHIQDPETQFFKIKKAYNYEDTFNQYLTGKDNTIRGGINYYTNIGNYLEIISGLEYEHTKSIPPYANDQVLGNSVKYEDKNADLIDELLKLKEDRYAGFFQITYKPVKIINIIGGLRYDYSSRYKGTINPRIGIIASPSGSTTIKMLYGTAFQAPSLFLLYEQFGAETAVMLSTEEVRRTEPAWELKNQKIKTYEISIDQNINKNLHLNFSLYHHLLRDLIERVNYTDSAYNKYFSDENTNIYSLGFRNENIGIQKINGLTASLYAKINNDLTGYLHYSYTDAIAEKNGEDETIPRIAKNKIWFGFTLRNLFGYFTVSPRFKWVGKINNRNVSVFPDRIQPGYSTLDLSVAVNNLVDHARFFVRLENILNSDIKHGGLYDQIFYLPTAHQPGFLFKIGIEFIF